MRKYRPRILDSIIAQKLTTKGALLIEGPKWCGKTTTAEQFAESKIMLSRPDLRNSFRNLIEINSEKAIDKKPPLLIDEWQTVPKLWDAVRYEVDHRGKPGQFILTGSAVPDKSENSEIEHSGTGRFSWITMRPMTLFESGESNGAISLRELFENTVDKNELFENKLTLNDISYLMCRGGWPYAVDLTGEAALEQAFDYYDAITKEDIMRVDGVKRSSDRARLLLKAYARHQGTSCSIAKLKKDIAEYDNTILDENTLVSYIEAFRKIFVIEDMGAWNPNLRSKTAIRTANTRYFIDPSIATAALGLGPKDLMDDLNTMGLLFETLCARELRVYSQQLHGEVLHYRDKTGLECDMVIHLRNGKYGLVEIKLGGQTLIEDGAATLNKLESRIDVERMKAPSFKMVLTAVGEYAYNRKEDNVFVVPVGCLRP